MLNNFQHKDKLITVKTDGFSIIPKGTRVSLLGEWYMIDEAWAYPHEDKCNYKVIKL